MMLVMSASPLQRAVDECGGQTALAARIGVKQGHVWWWLNKSGRVPAEKAIEIENATFGVVTRSDLRPDIYPPDNIVIETRATIPANPLQSKAIQQ